MRQNSFCKKSLRGIYGNIWENPTKKYTPVKKVKIISPYIS